MHIKFILPLNRLLLEDSGDDLVCPRVGYRVLKNKLCG